MTRDDAAGANPDGDDRHLNPTEGKPSEKRWAMVGESVIRRLVCTECLRLYCYLLSRQGTPTYRIRGMDRIARELSRQVRYIKKHALHLAEVGLIELDPEPGRSWSKTRIRVLHAPPKGWHAPDLREQEGVWEWEPAQRWRPPNNLATLKTDAGRVAPSVPQEARRAPASGATRLPSPTNAERDAPCVPLSPMCEEVVSDGEVSPSLGQPVPDNARRCRKCPRWATDLSGLCRACIAERRARLTADDMERVDSGDAPCPVCEEVHCICPFDAADVTTGSEVHA